MPEYQPQNPELSKETQTPLTFEEFSADQPSLPIPRSNNFIAHFFKDHDILLTEIYRGAPALIKLREENPKLEHYLTENITSELTANKSGTTALVKKYERKLYEAYKIMRKYNSDSELFT